MTLRARWPLGRWQRLQKQKRSSWPFSRVLNTPSPCSDLVFRSVHRVYPRWDPWHSRECSQEDLGPHGNVWWELEGSARMTPMDAELPLAAISEFFFQ